jgi:hypothetical protein
MYTHPKIMISASFYILIILVAIAVTEPLFPNLLNGWLNLFISRLGRLFTQVKMEAELIAIQADKNRYLEFVKENYPERPLE